LLRPIGGVGCDDVEDAPIDALERQRGVAQLSAEARADHLDGPSQEVLHTRAERSDRRPHANRISDQRNSLLERVTGEEADREEAHLGTREKDDIGAASSYPLGALGAVGEQLEERVLRETV